jgi:hypothetical protein
MVSEKEIIISFLFKRSGKELLKFSDLYLALSMELNWFTPDDAKSFISQALKEGILTKKDDMIKPNFDYENTDIPTGFTPSINVLEEKKEEKPVVKDDSLIQIMINKLVEKSNIEKSQIIKEIETLAKERYLTKEVASLLIGKKYNINFENLYNRVEESIIEDN